MVKNRSLGRGHSAYAESGTGRGFGR